MLAHELVQDAQRLRRRLAAGEGHYYCIQAPEFLQDGAAQVMEIRVIRAEDAHLPADETAHRVAVTMRTPGHDEELAAGFLLSEGIVRRREDVLRVEPCGRSDGGNVVNVLLSPEVAAEDRSAEFGTAASTQHIETRGVGSPFASTAPATPPVARIRALRAAGSAGS